MVWIQSATTDGKAAALQKGLDVLDLATGTGDVAIQIMRYKQPSVGAITAMDMAEDMIAIGADKVAELGYETFITFQKGDAHALPLEDNAYDVVTVSFGVRNFENLQQGLSEIPSARSSSQGAFDCFGDCNAD